LSVSAAARCGVQVQFLNMLAIQFYDLFQIGLVCLIADVLNSFAAGRDLLNRRVEVRTYRHSLLWRWTCPRISTLATS